MILNSLQKRSPLSVPELEKLLKASPATVRRDLSFLEKLGKIVRTHGGALHPDHADGEISFDRKSKHALKTKLALAEAAAELVAPGDSVFVDAGTTTLEVGKRLLAAQKVTIFTNSIPLLNERPGAGARLIGVGGEVRSVSKALVGPVALEWLNRVTFDAAFLGTSGIEPANGPTSTELTEAGVKSAVIGKARRVILLADATKWAQPADIRFADWRQIRDFFTDRPLTPAEEGALAEQGTTLHLVTK